MKPYEEHDEQLIIMPRKSPGVQLAVCALNIAAICMGLFSAIGLFGLAESVGAVHVAVLIGLPPISADLAYPLLWECVGCGFLGLAMGIGGLCQTRRPLFPFLAMLISSLSLLGVWWLTLLLSAIGC